MRQNRGRNRFVLSMFVVGAIVPLALMTFGRLAGPTNAGAASSAHTTVGQWVFLWLIWPTWILMLDAEHLGTIIFVLLFAAPLNGLWYALVASLSWYTGARLRRLASRAGLVKRLD
jgi:hypothetical protein